MAYEDEDEKPERNDPYLTEQERVFAAEAKALRKKVGDLEHMVVELREQKARLYAVVDRALVDLSRLGMGPPNIKLPPRDAP
jgi:hypothetical protein